MANFPDKTLEIEDSTLEPKYKDKLTAGFESLVPQSEKTCSNFVICEQGNIPSQRASKHPPVVQLDIKPEFTDSNKSGDDNQNGNYLSSAEEEEEMEEETVISESQKASERNRRQDAITAEYLRNIIKTEIKKRKKTQLPTTQNQSTKSLINHSGIRRIISTPREYQVELFNLAKENNIIAVLDTGSGKTFIAVLLLRHINSQELEDRALGKKRRVSFFLVDSVQLVFQQEAFLKANLNVPMQMFCGYMGCDLWNKEQWEVHFNENDIIICTAEILRQCLHHSFIKMQDINLLIFDEAHHAKKDHAYARIIKDFYATEPSNARRPRIFGMTASPVDARVDVRKAATELEAILDCKIATAKDGSLLRTTNRIDGRNEERGKYAPLLPKFKTSLYHEIHRCLSENRLLRKPLRFSYEASRELGSWCSDHVWTFCLSDFATKKLIVKSGRQDLATKAEPEPEALQKVESLIQEAKNIIENHNFEPPDYSDDRSWSKNLSSKVVLLIRYLRERYERETDDKCIVFVEERYTARLLARLFEQDRIKTEWLRTGTLIGTGNDDAGDLCTSFRDQVVTLSKFRMSELNCLFATSVAEEGLDIPDCNLIIRFDLYKTLIQYIQSRGRARHPNSKYIHLYEAGNQDHANIIMEVRKNEGILRHFCEILPEDRKLSGNDICIDDILAREKYNRVTVVPETGALLNYKMSLIILANFVDRLPNSAEGNYQVEYVLMNKGGKFQCEAVLPETSPISGAIGQWTTTKQEAKCSAAYETCLKLLEGEFLDKQLVPIYTKKTLPAMRNAKLALNSKKRSAYSMRTKPSLWSAVGTPGKLFASVLYLKNPDAADKQTQPLVLLTREYLPQLPSFLLHFSDGRHSPACCNSIGFIAVNDDLIEQLNTYTLCIFDDVFSKAYKSDPTKMPYFLVPAVAGLNFEEEDLDAFNVIDWDMVETIFNYQQKWSEEPWSNLAWKNEPDQFFVDKFIVDPYDGSRKLWSISVTKDLKPLDPVPINTAPRTGPRKNNSNIMEYSCSLWANARRRREFDPDQRVIEAEYISLRRNLLDEFDTQNNSSKKCYIILQPLKISPLPSKVVAMAYIFPAIIHRMESYLISLEACALLHLDIKTELALEALTKDSDDSNELGNESDKICFQRGMGNNYERLEFLGDCFLKMATSISLYGLQPENNEFAYHVDRMMLTSNKNLKDNALKLKLYEFIRSRSFSRRAWYPEGLVLIKGKGAKIVDSHNLADKTIADVCEAFIGAALLSYHDSKNMDMAVRAVTELVCSELHTAIAFADYYKLYQKPNYQTQKPTQSQLRLAEMTEQQHPYKFRYPRLLCSAFTHPSFPRSYNGNIPSYQRLEFLGDSLLDMVCINFLFHNYPGKDPQWLTEHKMAMVSNMFLGALCVKLGFNKHLQVFNASFIQQNQYYIDDITEARAQAEKEAIDAGKLPDDCSPDYWTSVRHPPKCFPDMVEAYIGAIFVDSEYNFSEVEKFFDAHIAWFFRDITIYDSFANNHPTTSLSRLLETNMGCHAWSLKVGDISIEEDDKSTIMVMIIIHGTVITHASADNSKYAKLDASKKALEILEGVGLGEFRTKYDCDCQKKSDGLNEVGQVLRVSNL